MVLSGQIIPRALLKCLSADAHTPAQGSKTEPSPEQPFEADPAAGTDARGGVEKSVTQNSASPSVANGVIAGGVVAAGGIALSGVALAKWYAKPAGLNATSFPTSATVNWTKLVGGALAKKWVSMEHSRILAEPTLRATFSGPADAKMMALFHIANKDVCWSHEKSVLEKSTHMVTQEKDANNWKINAPDLQLGTYIVVAKDKFRDSSGRDGDHRFQVVIESEKADGSLQKNAEDHCKTFDGLDVRAFNKEDDEWRCPCIVLVHNVKSEKGRVQKTARFILPAVTNGLLQLPLLEYKARALTGVDSGIVFHTGRICLLCFDR